MEFKNEIDNVCGFHIQKNGDFCSPINIVDKLKEFVVNFRMVDSKHTNVLETLKEKYNCKSEVCVLRQSEIKKYVDPSIVEKSLKENFKPSGPRETKAWLSNFDIDDVLAQIQKKYEDKHFFHVPFQMIDFEKTKSELARLNWPEEYAKGFRTFGTVVNTDYSTGNGIHWFAIFGDFLDESETFTIEYFNSSGELPMAEISLWMKRVKHEWGENWTKPIKDIVATRILNQLDGFSCGPYSLYYIISRLDGTPYSYFKNNKIGDKNMQLFRKFLFRDEN